MSCKRTMLGNMKKIEVSIAIGALGGGVPKSLGKRLDKLKYRGTTKSMEMRVLLKSNKRLAIS